MVTRKQLEAIVSRINTITKSPQEPYKTVDGKLVPQAGCFYLYGAYGGISLRRMQPSGGDMDVLASGFVSNKQMESLLRAFLAGLRLRNM